MSERIVAKVRNEHLKKVKDVETDLIDLIPDINDLTQRAGVIGSKLVGVNPSGYRELLILEQFADIWQLLSNLALTVNHLLTNEEPEEETQESDEWN
ncbi:hypothetical protein GO003_018945 [Methylicorpusculum oleiharenae]|uniref:hypothetical protein n=1 Tax=Methylicorpusculum oleiharenae TaxID=1338687 RepID=UPI001359385A|nr:hypothetical protein [Methylicorpusculum oleiharenae]MCD2452465.1 hypothetical protein [Methylicorpusculum oleiharenae]